MILPYLPLAAVVLLETDLTSQLVLTGELTLPAGYYQSELMQPFKLIGDET